MLLSISTASLYGISPGRFCALAAEAGFDGIELVLGPRTPLRRCEQVARMARDNGLVVCSVHESLAAGRLIHRSPAALLADAAEAAARSGTPLVVVHPPGTHGWWHPHASAWLEALLKARDASRIQGVSITVENPGHYVPDDSHKVLAQLGDLVAFCQRHTLGMTLDTCHVGTTGETLADAWKLAEDLVQNVHVSDLCSPEGMVGNGLARKLAHEHRFPGEGGLPLDSFLGQIHREGYRGPVTMEVSAIALGGWGVQRWLERLASLASWARHATHES